MNLTFTVVVDVVVVVESLVDWEDMELSVSTMLTILEAVEIADPALNIFELPVKLPIAVEEAPNKLLNLDRPDRSIY